MQMLRLRVLLHLCAKSVHLEMMFPGVIIDP